MEILRHHLPQHELFNFGKGGDTVISLCRRLHRVESSSPMDLGFLWIGVNDVFVKTRRSFPLIKRLRNKPWAKNPEEFQERYRPLLEFLRSRVGYIFTIPPLLIGEDIHNEWNLELSLLSKIIRELSASYANVEFIDLRDLFISRLESKKTSPYVPKSVLRVIRDALFIDTPEEMELAAEERGLHFTIDGVHLNTAGAVIVAEQLLQKIEGFRDRDSAAE